jgi:predicted ABC-type transport system involved in lysophospholipase L1 biosynthesis ATPase subunit
VAALEKAEADTSERAAELRVAAGKDVEKYRARLAEDEQSLAMARLVAENLGVSFDDEPAEGEAGQDQAATPTG